MASGSTSQPLGRTAAWLALANSAWLAAPLLWTALTGHEPALAVGAAVAFFWTGSAPWAAACLVAGSGSRAGALALLGVELLLILSSALVLYDLTYGDPSSTAGLVYFTGPLVQWGFLLLAAAVAFGAGWRMRESWPDPA